MIELYSRYVRYSARLRPLERVGFHAGIIACTVGAAETEIGNPLLGATHFIVGLCLLDTSRAPDTQNSRHED